MGISESAVKQWVSKSCALIDGATLDYLTVCIPSTRAARSFIEHAKVLCGDKSTNDVCNEVWGHVEDILESSANEGKSEVAIRFLLYRNKAPAGSTTMRSDIAPRGNTDEDDDSGNNNTNMANALVGVVKELRLSNKDLLGVVQQAAGEGWRLAGDMMKANQKLQQDNTELQIVLAMANNEDKPDAMKELTVKTAEGFIEVMKMKAMMKMQEEAAEKAKLG